MVIDSSPQNNDCPLGDQFSGKLVSAARAVPPAEAKAPNQRKDIPINTHSAIENFLLNLTKPCHMLSPVIAV